MGNDGVSRREKILVSVAGGVLLLALAIWLILSLLSSGGSTETRTLNENGVLAADGNSNQRPSAQGGATFGYGAPQPARPAASEGAPQATSVQGAPPPPDAQAAPAAAPQQAMRGLPSARTAPDSGRGREAMRASMKQRIESTTPEDRAMRAKFRAEEMKYRAAHGGTPGGGGRGGGGGGRGPGGPPSH